MQKTSEQLIQEVHQAVLGVEHSEDKGLYGAVKDIKKSLAIQNGRLRKLEIRVWGIVVAAGVLSSAVGVTIYEVFSRD